jgi:hypothetical protein
VCWWLCRCWCVMIGSMRLCWCVAVLMTVLNVLMWLVDKKTTNREPHTLLHFVWQWQTSEDHPLIKSKTRNSPEQERGDTNKREDDLVQSQCFLNAPLCTADLSFQYASSHLKRWTKWTESWSANKATVKATHNPQIRARDCRTALVAYVWVYCSLLLLRGGGLGSSYGDGRNGGDSGVTVDSDDRGVMTEVTVGAGDSGQWIVVTAVTRWQWWQWW